MSELFKGLERIEEARERPAGVSFMSGLYDGRPDFSLFFSAEKLRDENPKRLRRAGFFLSELWPRAHSNRQLEQHPRLDGRGPSVHRHRHADSPVWERGTEAALPAAC